eukprot:747649-Hanusia_phi.AAC.4
MQMKSRKSEAQKDIEDLSRAAFSLCLAIAAKSCHREVEIVGRGACSAQGFRRISILFPVFHCSSQLEEQKNVAKKRQSEQTLLHLKGQVVCSCFTGSCDEQLGRFLASPAILREPSTSHRRWRLR